MDGWICGLVDGWMMDGQMDAWLDFSYCQLQREHVTQIYGADVVKIFNICHTLKCFVVQQSTLTHLVTKRL